MMQEKAISISAFPSPPEGAVFRLRECKTIHVPHPYCISAAHVEHASDKFCGMLGRDAIESAERHGIKCYICKGKYSYAEHKAEQTLVITVPDNRDLNAIPGLHAYLLSIKLLAESLGITGFTFPTAAQVY
mgnify:CR=1 FL=1